MTARTTTARASTNTKNNGSAALTTAPRVVRRRSAARPANTSVPAAAAHAGLMPAAEAMTNPARVAATVTIANHGAAIRSGASGAVDARVVRSRAKNLRNTANSIAIATSHGSVISAANRTKVNPLAENASRLVRFDTGSSSEPVFDKCVQAYT